MTWYAFLTNSHHLLDPGKWEPKLTSSSKQERKFLHHIVVIWLLQYICDLLLHN